MRHIIFLLISVFLSLLSTKAQLVSVEGIPRDTSFTVYQTFIKQKKYFPDIRIAKAKVTKPVKAFINIPYKSVSNLAYGERELTLSIYRPDDTERHPALLMIHGGGWSSGDPSLQVPLAIQIAEKGYVTIPVEYRLSPEALYPAAIYDIKSAIKWVRENAEHYLIDPKRIAVSGCSAGGQLANLCGVTNENYFYEDPADRNSPWPANVQAVINVDGISDFRSEETIERARNSKGSDKIPADVKWLGGTYEEIPEIWESACPVTLVNQKAVPVCFINSSIPRFHYGRDEMIEKLDALGIYSEVHTIPDTPHPFWLFDPWFLQTADYMTTFLDRIFSNP
ncbi:MAG: alpha/beta hydrolase [Candidatus Azobacteroides sp.]|nr:alpha/beta hydrolase [Candidatus Azobacteroides sp.]